MQPMVHVLSKQQRYLQPTALHGNTLQDMPIRGIGHATEPANRALGNQLRTIGVEINSAQVEHVQLANLFVERHLT